MKFYLSVTVLKNIWIFFFWWSLFSVKFNAFYYILLNTFSVIIIPSDAFHFRHLSNIFILLKPHCKNLWWKNIKNYSCKTYLGNKKQRSNNSTCSLIWLTPRFCLPVFLLAGLSLQAKLRARKIGWIEINWSSLEGSLTLKF